MTDVQSIFLACHETRCGWDVLGAPWYVTTNRTNQRIWERKTPCLRDCGSIKRERVKSDGTFAPIGKPKIIRPEGWYDNTVYFSAAKRERILAQQATIGFATVLSEGKTA